jgi:hypothetical protein
MIDHTDDGLRAAIKALDEVIAPSIDAANPLAVEQLRLVSRFLGFVRSRLPYEHARERHELRHYLALAAELVAQAPDDAPVRARQLLQSAISEATPLAVDIDAPTAALRAGIASLSSALSTLVRSVATSPPEVREAIELAVIRASRTLLDAQRAWFLPIGFEPDPDQVPPIDQALAARR